ncbi:MAG: PDZ domain-containing protein [Dehalococcoidia bacterium]|nr:PDZ domain-containing protein [Dehalococcoidia bacterium]
MTAIDLSDRLRVALTGMLAQETAIHATAGHLSGRVSDHGPTPDLLAGIRQISGNHLTAIRERLGVLPEDETPAEIGSLSGDHTGFAEWHPVSDSLCTMYSLMGEAVIRYSAMQPITNRLADSWAVASEGTSAHIARAHTQEYLALMGRITNVVHDAVIWELDQDGLECLCTCPSCSLGVCLCAVAARGILAPALASAMPRVTESGIEVLRPRTGSAGERAGMLQGDVVVAVEGAPIGTIPEFQATIQGHEPGLIELGVLRDGEQIVLTCETT